MPRVSLPPSTAATAPAAHRSRAGVPFDIPLVKEHALKLKPLQNGKKSLSVTKIQAIMFSIQ